MDGEPGSAPRNHDEILAGLERQLADSQGREAELRSRLADLRLLFDTLPALIWRKDLQSRIVDLNRLAAESTRARFQDAVGQSTSTLHPDEGAKYVQDDQEVFRTNQAKRGILELFTLESGEKTWVQTDKLPLHDQEGNLCGLVVFAQDVTAGKLAEDALRKSKERMELALEAAQMGTWEIDLETRRLHLDQRQRQLFELSASDLSIGLETFYASIHPEDRGKANETLERALSTGQPFSQEFRILTPSGVSRWLASVGKAEIDPMGRRTRMIGVVQDISERKQAEEAREDLIRQLEEKNAELERFTYTVSHDLKSPLITIKGFLGFLEKDAAEGNLTRLRSDIARIENAADRMKNLLDELLELSRIGRLVNPSETISVGELAGEALELLAGSLNRVQPRVQIDPDLPLVHGDKARLREVLQNLLENALKFMGQQSEPQIRIGMRPGPGGPVFLVEDNGIGIEPRFHEKIFGLFEKLEADADGTGIGLTIVRRIIESHNGSIWVESQGPGTGSTFCFTLPALARGHHLD